MTESVVPSGDEKENDEKENILRELGAQRAQQDNALREQIIRAVTEDGISERRVHALTGVARSTIRVWLGKQTHHPRWKKDKGAS